MSYNRDRGVAPTGRGREKRTFVRAEGRDHTRANRVPSSRADHGVFLGRYHRKGRVLHAAQRWRTTQNLPHLRRTWRQVGKVYRDTIARLFDEQISNR
jgi:hypothetical protein